MAWGSTLTAETTTAETLATPAVPAEGFKPFKFDASTVEPAVLKQADISADELDQALSVFLETGNLYTVAMRCKKPLEVIERLFANPFFKERLESAKKQLDNLYVVFAERTLFEIAQNRYLNESARTQAARAILDRADRKTAIAELMKRIEQLEANGFHEGDEPSSKMPTFNGA